MTKSIFQYSVCGCYIEDSQTNLCGRHWPAMYKHVDENGFPIKKDICQFICRHGMSFCLCEDCYREWNNSDISEIYWHLFDKNQPECYNKLLLQFLKQFS